MVFPIPMLMEQFIKFQLDESNPWQGHPQYSPLTFDQHTRKFLHLMQKDGETIKLIPKLKRTLEWMINELRQENIRY